MTEEPNLSIENEIKVETLVAEEAAVEEICASKRREIEQDILAIQKSTKVSIPIFSSWHNKLRARYDWYYRWHLKRSSSLLHLIILLGVVGGILFEFFNSYLH